MKLFVYKLVVYSLFRHCEALAVAILVLDPHVAPLLGMTFVIPAPLGSRPPKGEEMSFSTTVHRR